MNFLQLLAYKLVRETIYTNISVCVCVCGNYNLLYCTIDEFSEFSHLIGLKFGAAAKLFACTAVDSATSKGEHFYSHAVGIKMLS